MGMAKYLVTGAAGFIGSKVSELLLADNHVVIGVDNLNDAYDVRLKQWRLARLCSQPNFRFHCLDIGKRREVMALFEQPVDASDSGFAGVINLAARAGVRPSVMDPWTYFETNTTGTLNLLELCREFAIPKFVLSSTSSLYGRDNPMPWQEDQNTSLPLSPYAASKKAAEVLCHTYHYLYGIDVTIFRYFTVYGPAGRPDMSLFRFVQWISEGRPVHVFGDGKQSRDFTYVDDIARGTVAGLKSVGYEIVNLGSDEPIVLLDAIHLVEEAVGKKAVLQFEDCQAADIPASWADIHKARRVLNWRPSCHFATGMEALVNWYMTNRTWAHRITTLG
jgi:nucleoside-diphosphate-sugar epimerase